MDAYTRFQAVMKLSRVRFTIRGLMLAIAVAGVGSALAVRPGGRGLLASVGLLALFLLPLAVPIGVVLSRTPAVRFRPFAREMEPHPPRGGSRPRGGLRSVHRRESAIDPAEAPA